VVLASKTVNGKSFSEGRLDQIVAQDGCNEQYMEGLGDFDGSCQCPIQSTHSASFSPQILHIVPAHTVVRTR
jgi:hypothetical protein